MRYGSVGRSSEKSGSGRISPPRKRTVSEAPTWAAVRPSMAGALKFTASAVAACRSRRRDNAVLSREGHLPFAITSDLHPRLQGNPAALIVRRKCSWAGAPRPTREGTSCSQEAP